MAGTIRPLLGRGKRSATESGSARRGHTSGGSGRVTDEVAAKLVPGWPFKQGSANLHVFDKFVVDASWTLASQPPARAATEGHEPICLRLTHLAD